MSSIDKAAKEAGVDQVVCPHCGSKFPTKDAIKLFFKGILGVLNTGDRVNIPGFGIFTRKLLKGRSHDTPIIKGGLSFTDTWVLRFKQSKIAKGVLNGAEEETEVKDAS